MSTLLERLSNVDPVITDCIVNKCSVSVTPCWECRISFNCFKLKEHIRIFLPERPETPIGEM
jgi:hypothetical protein